MNLDLKTPLAIEAATGALVSAEDAKRGETYFCPGCGDELIFKAGAVKVHHFAHKPSQICSQETIIHKTAKLVIKQAIASWKAGTGPAPVIRRRCEVCRTRIDVPLPEKVDRAALEVRLDNGFIVDLGLMVNGRPEAGIEIFVTHAVDAEKSENLALPFVELDGYAVIDNPLQWTPIKDHFRPFTCRACTEAFRRFQARTAQIARYSKIELPEDYFRYAPISCWRCKKSILVFTWPGKQLHEDRPPRKEPTPRTIQYMYSKTLGGNYWANSCPYCQAIQGDWFLHFEPDGPFWSLSPLEDSVEAFNQDLRLIAARSRL